MLVLVIAVAVLALVPPAATTCSSDQQNALKTCYLSYTTSLNLPPKPFPTPQSVTTVENTYLSSTELLSTLRDKYLNLTNCVTSGNVDKCVTVSDFAALSGSDTNVAVNYVFDYRKQQVLLKTRNQAFLDNRKCYVNNYLKDTCMTQPMAECSILNTSLNCTVQLYRQRCTEELASLMFDANSAALAATAPNCKLEDYPNRDNDVAATTLTLFSLILAFFVHL